VLGERKGGKRKRVLWGNQKTDPEKEEQARKKGNIYDETNTMQKYCLDVFFGKNAALSLPAGGVHK